MDSIALLGYLADVHWTVILVTFTSIIFATLIISLLKCKGVVIFENLTNLFQGNRAKVIGKEGTVAEICKKYGLTKSGFLPAKCAEVLPHCYDDWENIAAVLPELNRTRKLQEEVENMKLLTCDKLENEADRRRAYIILGMLVHSYVNGSKVPWERLDDCILRRRYEEKEDLTSAIPHEEYDVNNTNSTATGSTENKFTRDTSGSSIIGDIRESLENGNVTRFDQTKKRETIEKASDSGLITMPSQLAIPWYTICCRLDLPFILTAALDLWNWKLKDPKGPKSLSNLTLIASMTGTETETYFHMVPCAMQAVAGPVIPKVLAFYEEMKQRCTKVQEKHDSQTKNTNSKRAATSIGTKIDDATNEADNEAFESREYDTNSIADVHVLIKLLNDVEAVFQEFKEIAKQIKDLVDKDTFYDIYRPLLSGFWPDGVVLDLSGIKGEYAKEFQMNHLEKSMTPAKVVNIETNVSGEIGDDKGVSADMKFAESSMTGNGISDREREAKLPDASSHETLKYETTKESNHQKCHENLKSNRQAFISVVKERLSDSKLIVNPKGPSAGQSTMILLFDLLLGIQHVGSGKDFQLEMLNYMPWQHRQMVIDFRELVARFGSIRDIILKLRYDADYAQMVAAFNGSVNAVAAFRELHLGIAVKYLVRAEKGTGSSSFRDMLNIMVQGTKNALI